MLRTSQTFIGTLLLIAAAGQLRAQVTGLGPSPPKDSRRASNARLDDTPRQVLSEQEWRQVDSSVNRGLTFLAAQQQPDGSFPSIPNAQPAVTSLCVLAFMAHGHNPGSGPYGERLDRAVKYIIECQKRSGLVMLLASDEPQIN